MSVIVQAEDFDLGKELKIFRDTSAEIGAIVSFVGLVRDVNLGKCIDSMILEHYPGMTEKILCSIETEALTRWEINDVRIIHRVGMLHPADQIVLVMVSSKHRGEAFNACEFLIDYLKTQAPFWKKETSDQSSHWVESRDKDQASMQRWIKD